jgi:hypothetical protein
LGNAALGLQRKGMAGMAAIARQRWPNQSNPGQVTAREDGKTRCGVLD